MNLFMRGYRAASIINSQSVLSSSMMSLLMEDYANKTKDSLDLTFATGFSGDTTGKRNRCKNAIAQAFAQVDKIPLKELTQTLIQNFCYIMALGDAGTFYYPSFIGKFSIEDIETLTGEFQSVYRLVNESLDQCDCFEKETFAEKAMAIQHELHRARKAKMSSDDEATAEAQHERPSP